MAEVYYANKPGHFARIDNLYKAIPVRPLEQEATYESKQQVNITTSHSYLLPPAYLLSRSSQNEVHTHSLGSCRDFASSACHNRRYVDEILCSNTLLNFKLTFNLQRVSSASLQSQTTTGLHTKRTSAIPQSRTTTGRHTRSNFRVS